MFFLDESGHDHQQCPYEVRGGIVLHASKLWGFVQQFASLEETCFGVRLSEFQVEIKGSRLLEQKRFRHANQGELLDDLARRKHCLSFLNKGRQKASPTEIEFRAYGQACLEMCRGIFRLLQSNDVKVFAAAIPRKTKRPKTTEAEEYLRKDFVYLLERYANFLSVTTETGLLVFDETEASADQKLIRQIERYFTRTVSGRFRANSIVPVPFFVSSDLTRAIQAADVCIYTLNWGFRVPRGMDATTRPEIASEFSSWITSLQASGRKQEGLESHIWYSIVFVPEPYAGSLPISE